MKFLGARTKTLSKTESRENIETSWNKVKRFILSDFGKPFIAFLAIFLAAGALSPYYFFTPYNQSALALSASTYILLGAGEMLVILLGSIDLSASYLYVLSVMLSGYLYAYVFHSLIPSIIITLIIIMIFGVANGLLVAKAKIYSFVATLGTGFIAYGLALVITKGASIYPLPAFTVFALKVATYIPIPFIISIIVLILLYILLRYSIIGRYVYAIGSNEEASYYAGINVDMTKILMFAIAAILYGLAGIITVGILNSATPEVASGTLLLYAIAASVLGGIELTGGVGSPWGPLFGGYIISIVIDLMVLLGINVYMQYVVTGIVLLLAVISLSRGKRFVK